MMQINKKYHSTIVCRCPKTEKLNYKYIQYIFAKCLMTKFVNDEQTLWMYLGQYIKN